MSTIKFTGFITDVLSITPNYSVFGVRQFDGGYVKVIGQYANPVVGHVVEVDGYWVNNPKYGWQVRAISCQSKTVATEVVKQERKERQVEKTQKYLAGSTASASQLQTVLAHYKWDLKKVASVVDISYPTVLRYKKEVVAGKEIYPNSVIQFKILQAYRNLG